jgi:hypothetical protein
LIALSLAAAAACGIALVRAALPHRGGWLIGSAGLVAGLALSGAAWSAGLLLFGATGAGADLALLALAGFFLLRKRLKPTTATSPSPSPSTSTSTSTSTWASTSTSASVADAAPAWLWVACAVAALVVTALFLRHSIRYPDGAWDASAIWNLRARSLFAAPERLADVFSPDLAAQQPDYPLLMPGLIAHAWTALGSWTPAVPIAVSFLFAAAGTVALGAAISARRGPVLALAAVLLLLGTPDLVTLAWNQYADLKLAMLLLVAVVLADERSFAAAGLVAGLAAFTKNEALLELGTLALAVLIAAGRRALLRFALGAALPLALLEYFKLRWAPPNGLVATTAPRDILLRAPRRLGVVAGGFVSQLWDFAHWGCALAFVALAHVAGFRGRRRGSVAAPFIALTLPIFFCIYLVTPWNPAEHMRTSLDRLIFQLWPSMLYLTAAWLDPRRFQASAAAATASETQPGQSPSTS